MKKFVLSVVFGLSFLLSAAPAQALILDRVDSGWYNHAGTHFSSNQNYIVGFDGASTYRNWFVFDLSSVDGVIVSATLRLDTATVYSSGLYSIYDVTTDITTLRAGGAGLTGIYDDLGTGALYGAHGILASEDDIIKDFVLNANAITALNSATGLFAVGGAYSENTGSAFALSHEGNKTRQLVLEIRPFDPVNPIPEPASMVLLGSGLLGVAGLRRKRS